MINLENIIIKPVKAEDNPTLAKIIRDVFLEYGAEQIGTVYSDPTTDNLYDLFTKEDAHLYTASYNGEMLGCCGIYPTENLPKGYTELVKFYISNKGRGQGVGRILMNNCEEKAKSIGYSHIYLESLDSFAKAVGIYEKTGYKYLDKPLGNTGHFGCNIWMKKKL